MIDLWFDDLLTTFSDPSKRVFIGYLFSSLFIALVWLCLVEKRSVVGAFSHVFSKNNWWSQSAKADYQLFFINKVIMLLISPALLAQITLATLIFYQLFEWLPSRPLLSESWSDTSVIIVFTLCYFIFDDFMRFYVHRLMHRIPVLWAFHKVHHSAKTMNPMTVFRTHPVEGIVFSLRSSLVQGVTIGGLVFFMGDRADFWMVFGAVVFTALFNLLGSNLRHSSVAIYYWRWLENIMISPAQHQIHHSLDPKHYDKNYGVVLAIWDRCFGSHHYSEKGQVLAFGLAEETASPHSLYQLYCTPFLQAWLALCLSTKKMITVFVNQAASLLPRHSLPKASPEPLD